MDDHAFDLLRQAFESGGAESGFDLLIRRLLEEKDYPRLFEARLLRTRWELGLPLVQHGPLDSVPEAARPAYEQAFIEAAREAGGLFLAAGDIARAWPYFRALGETAPVAAAIERVQPGEDIENIVAIAYQERVNPRKGFELILAHYGTCRAITSFEAYPGAEGRDECLRLLVRTLHAELLENLRRTIERQEGSAPESTNVPELMAGRDWLFADNNYYVDTSHLVAVLRFSLDLEDVATLGLARELAEYGRHLSPMYMFRVDPPFQNVYKDHAIYLGALAGEGADGAVVHFRRKVADSNPDEAGTAPAQVLVTLLVRLKRYSEAIEIAREHLAGVPPAQLGCPSVFELCQLAGDWRRLAELARAEGDPLEFAAGVLGGSAAGQHLGQVQGAQRQAGAGERALDLHQATGID